MTHLHKTPDDELLLERRRSQKSRFSISFHVVPGFIGSCIFSQSRYFNVTFRLTVSLFIHTPPLALNQTLKKKTTTYEEYPVRCK